MDPLYELLTPYFDQTESPSLRSQHAAAYLTRLSTLSLADLTSNEPASLLQSAQSHLRNLQALSKRSHKAVIASSTHLEYLTSLLPSLTSQAEVLHNGLPDLEAAASTFAQKYDRSTENAVLDRRKRAMLLSRNVDRISDVLDLPTLLSSTVSSAQNSTSGAATSYASALDLNAHIKRLNTLYSHSELVNGVYKQAEAEIDNLITILITSLQSPTLKLAGAMRTVSWLRRVVPDLADDGHTTNRPLATSIKSLELSTNSASADGTLGSLFLVCRLHTLHDTLSALEPLRDLADQETSRRKSGLSGRLLKQQVSASALGSQSERYLKRYLEIFREQSFGIVSMYKSIFPSDIPTPDAASRETPPDDELLPRLPTPLATFALHLVDMLTATLRTYLPNITDKQARESLLTQVLYCAGSLGRLGADFGMMVALLEEDLRGGAELQPGAEVDGREGGSEESWEWEQVMKKHRVQASRLEVLARGVGTARKGSAEGELVSPTGVAAG